MRRMRVGRIWMPIKRLKRRIVNRRGDGVHSPYAFHIIHRVINCPYPFYCFDDLRAKEGHLCRTTDRLRRVDEAVFRLVHHHDRGDVFLCSPIDSPLVRYLQHLRPNSGLTSLQDAAEINLTTEAIVILESLSSSSVERVAEQLVEHLGRVGECVLIVYSRSEAGLSLLEQLGERCPADATFDFLDIQLWVWRRGLTPGHYKGLIK